jgi:hypothetical protein
MPAKLRTAVAALASAAAVAALGAPAASASKYATPIDVTSVQLTQTQSCPPKAGVPAYNLTATNTGCDVAVRVAAQWSEMVANYKCPRYRCEVREFVCFRGTEVSFSPRVSCSVGSRVVRWLTPTNFEQVAS